jgi:hypothetical protein
MLYLRKGNTTASNVRTCDTVSAGAFFPQVNLEMPQKEMRQHRREHMVMPALIAEPCREPSKRSARKGAPCLRYEG